MLKTWDVGVLGHVQCSIPINARWGDTKVYPFVFQQGILPYYIALAFSKLKRFEHTRSILGGFFFKRGRIQEGRGLEHGWYLQPFKPASDRLPRSLSNTNLIFYPGLCSWLPGDVQYGYDAWVPREKKAHLQNSETVRCQRRRIKGL
jgi:hypothetical protein